VDDLIRGLTQLMNVDGIGGEIINIGNPAELTIKEFAETVLELTGARSEIIYEPLPIDDPTRRQPDITKAKRLLNWEPLVGLHDGLIPTLDYFRSML
jgi:UDP-glucuronate decarboxylase